MIRLYVLSCKLTNKHTSIHLSASIVQVSKRSANLVADTQRHRRYFDVDEHVVHGRPLLFTNSQINQMTLVS